MHKVDGSGGPLLVRILAGIDRASVTQARDAFAVELAASLFMLALVLAIAMCVNRRPIGTPDRHPIGTPSSYVSGD